MKRPEGGRRLLIDGALYGTSGTPSPTNEKKTSRAMSLCMLSINGREDGEAVLPRLSKKLPGYKYRREG